MMNDSYTPLLTDFVFSELENDAIEIASKLKNPWDHDSVEQLEYREALENLKKRVRDFHMQRQQSTCCYCRRILHGGGHFVIDREHILPKEKFKEFTYSIWNIAVSCKRCNMEYKGRKWDFYKQNSNGDTDPNDSSNYAIVHPNMDRWEDHLCLRSKQVNAVFIVSYSVIDGSQKGVYNYDFFKLKGLATASHDEAQGLRALIKSPRILIETLSKAFKQA